MIKLDFTLKKRIGSTLIVAVCCIVGAASTWAVLDGRHQSQATTVAAAGAVTGSTGTAQMATGASGLPLPRFASLKAERVNVRKGPSSDHAVAWVFQRKGLPVEIIAESENWRRIRDSDGEEGWVQQNMLAGKRTAVIAPWRGGAELALHNQPQAEAPAVAMVQTGVLGQVKGCDGQWCEVETGGYSGYIQQDMLWGVYPSEQVS